MCMGICICICMWYVGMCIVYFITAPCMIIYRSVQVNVHASYPSSPPPPTSPISTRTTTENS
ncbi:hypothetical protein EON63_07490 [archaeon]|nr:MAG: hypothetical protein EON63_07490 [archaeon]